MRATKPITAAQIQALIPRSTLAGPQSLEATGLSRDSRQVKAGDVFVCIKGGAHDSHAYAIGAIQAGATILIVNRGGLSAAGIEDAIPDSVAVVTVRDTRLALALIACAMYDNPSHSMIMVGITGTNGKTTTTQMIASVLRQAGLRTGTIGTLGSDLDGEKIESDHTTPEADQLQAILAELRDRGANAVVMEVSSHALALHRTAGIAFRAGVFTNLTQDHLDFHGDMEHYFEAKAELFSRYPIDYPRPDGKAFIAVITISQWEGREMVTLARGDILTFATDDSPAVLTACDVTLTPSTVDFVASYDSGVEKFKIPIHLPVGGGFQTGNALAAIGACLRLGISPNIVSQGLANLQQVPGRFEAVPTNGLPFNVIVDYAHTPDGLEHLLTSASELKPNKLITVFGCGGNRDKTKRPIMGRIAASQSDIAIVTSDNPRHEDPAAIIKDIVTGIESMTPSERRAQILIEPDRRNAIETALTHASPGSLVVIAGKGHETYQLVGDAVLDFDDRVVASELITSIRASETQV